MVAYRSTIVNLEEHNDAFSGLGFLRHQRKSVDMAVSKDPMFAQTRFRPSDMAMSILRATKTAACVHTTHRYRTDLKRVWIFNILLAVIVASCQLACHYVLLSSKADTGQHYIHRPWQSQLAAATSLAQLSAEVRRNEFQPM